MTKQTRYPIVHVPESEILEWSEAGWTYVGPSETPDHCIIKWENSWDAVQPFRGEDELAHIHGGAALEAVA